MTRTKEKRFEEQVRAQTRAELKAVADYAIAIGKYELFKAMLHKDIDVPQMMEALRAVAAFDAKKAPAHNESDAYSRGAAFAERAYGAPLGRAITDIRSLAEKQRHRQFSDAAEGATRNPHVDLNSPRAHQLFEAGQAAAMLLRPPQNPRAEALRAAAERNK